MIKFLYSRTRSQWFAASAWFSALFILWSIGGLKSYEFLAYIGTFIVAIYIGHIMTEKN